MFLVTLNFILLALSTASSAPSDSTASNLTTNTQNSTYGSSTDATTLTVSNNSLPSTNTLSNRTSNASVGTINVSPQRQPGEVESVRNKSNSVASEKLNFISSTVMKATSPRNVTVPKKSKTWKNGDVLCQDSSECGKHGICQTTSSSGFNKRVCLCRLTFLPMTTEMRCPGKRLEDDDPWEPVECTHNSTICGDKSRCLGQHWGSAYRNRLFCFCRHTMEPMRTDFTCLPLTRFTSKEPKKYPPIDCTIAGISVCGEEAVCLSNPKNKSRKICICPHTNEPVGGPGLLCPRTIIASQDGEGEFTLPPAAWSKRPEKPKAAPSVSSSVSSSGFWSTTFSSPISLTLIFLVPILLCGFLHWRRCLRRREKINSHKKKIIIQMQTLQQKNYASNPQYSAADLDRESDPLLPVQTLPRSKITDLKKIGEGNFGTVYKGQLHIDSGNAEGKTVAVKILKSTTNPGAEEDFMREVEIMSTFQHKNILSLTGFCARDQENGPWMVFEYMPFGSLITILRDWNQALRNLPGGPPKLCPETLLTFAQQIANGMEYLTRRRFVHRDLACRNCLVGSDLVVKIADFGMTRDIHSGDYYQVVRKDRQVGGTQFLPIRWMSPESIYFHKFTTQSDIWSYGVVLWEIFSYGKQPYFGYPNEQVMEFILTQRLLNAPQQCPQVVTEIMKACWKADPEQRISFAEISERFVKLEEDFQNQSETLDSSAVQPNTIELSPEVKDTSHDICTANFENEATAEKSDEDNYLKLSPIVPRVPFREYSRECNMYMTFSELQELKEDGTCGPYPDEDANAKQSPLELPNDYPHPPASVTKDD